MLKISRMFVNLVVLIIVAISAAWSVSAKTPLLFAQGTDVEDLQKKPPARGSRLMEELDELQLSFKRKLPPPRGSRGGLCSIAPGVLEREFVIWSDRPRFLWQADTRQIKLQKLEILKVGTREYDAEILWDKTLAETAQSAEYEGQALQPGQTYRWQLTWMQQNQNQQWRPYKLERQFRIMAALERNQIATDLQTLTDQLRARQFSDEAIAIQQSKYFVDRGLLSDALQVLSMIQNPSAETTSVVQDLVKTVCNSGEKLSK